MKARHKASLLTATRKLENIFRRWAGLDAGCRCFISLLWSSWVLFTEHHLFFEVSTRLLPDGLPLTLGAVVDVHSWDDVRAHDRLVDCKNQGVTNRWNWWSENQSINRWQSMPINRLISIIDEQSMLGFYVIIDFIDYQFLSIINANRSVNCHRLVFIFYAFYFQSRFPKTRSLYAF